MPETILSPGVVAIENDQSLIPQGPIVADAAIIGPTVRGPVNIPTIVTSYDQYKEIFGESFKSGSTFYSYFTSIAAYHQLTEGDGALLITRVVSGSPDTDWTPATSSFISASSHSGGSPYNSSVFELETISEGIIMNSTSSESTINTLDSGSSDNFRWEIVSPNTSSGEFTLLIRQGNDSINNKSILHTIGPVTLDPNSSNYIEKAIGNQVLTVIEETSTGEYYTQLTGSYPNKYNTIRVKTVNQKTPDYLDSNGIPKNEFTGSIPIASSGSFGDAKGTNIPGSEGKYYHDITDTNIQGLHPHEYTESISLLANKDAYKYSLIVAPGLIADKTSFPNSNTVVNQLINTVESREDCMAIIDLAKYGEDLNDVVSNANDKDTSYAASYWPWVQTLDRYPNTLQNVWVPSSTLALGTYALNDSVGFPWLAPAGTTRGITNAVDAEKYLTQGVRDILYTNRVNPISTINNSNGTSNFVLFGQKTLQKRNTSLTRVNVRRLLINLKNFISRTADNFVFEQNTPSTRESILSIINPYLNLVQEEGGLTAFQVIMDETNNPPSVIDNNQLVGQIYIQPTRTAEFISLTFNILPTGATFPTT